MVKEEGRRWIAIVGIPLTVKPGTQQIEANGLGAEFHSRHQVLPRAAHHPEEPGAGQPEPGQPQAHRARAGRADARLPVFQRPPAEQPAVRQTGQRPAVLLGLRRFFNGEERNPHSGLDFAVGAGTPIKAPAARQRWCWFIWHSSFNLSNDELLGRNSGMIPVHIRIEQDRFDDEAGANQRKAGLVV